MKKLILVALCLGIGSIVFSACEKDDICGEYEETTPNFLIEFYSFEDQGIAKNDLVEAFVAGREKNIIKSNGNKLLIPLRLDNQESEWILKSVRRTQNQVDTLYDTLTFKYKINTKYLNKACGYVSTFSLNQDGTSPMLNGEAQQTSGNWIKHYTTETNEIQDSKKAHFKIYY
ncbi:DUF6452 family protein [Myroides sp. M-43]|uniref:DUF6452 family protein n=1 Tax=Myroides oncorhynchi TaxID=2893756 RepID=UPI001E457060|nr:DUF6452 family protein [Myroides oncorhynchi]MCC9044113.1 DUF6452 family protein [Myroides oncorhynchi]